MAAGLGALGDDGVAAALGQPRASATVVAEAITRAPLARTRSRRSSGRQPEVEADDLRTELLHDLAAGVVERDDGHVVGRRVGETELARSTAPARSRHAASAPPSTGWSSWQKKLRLTGPDETARKAASSARIAVGVEERARQRPEAAGLADGAGQRRALRRRHRRLHDRHLDAEQLQEPAVRPCPRHGATLAPSPHAPQWCPCVRGCATCSNIDVPIVLAPFGPWDEVDLAAAVCEAGALGSVGTAVRSVAELHEQWQRLRELTDRPFAINHTGRPFNDEAFDATLEFGPAAISFHMGIAADLIAAAHDRGILWLQTVGDVEAAVAAIDAGADVLIAQGTEAGGNAGWVTTMVLVPAVVDVAGDVPGRRRWRHRRRPRHRRCAWRSAPRGSASAPASWPPPR